MKDIDQIKFRNVLPQDIPFLLRLFERAVRQTCAKDYSRDQIEAWVKTAYEPGKWEKRVSEQYFIVAENGSDFLGFSSLRKDGYLDLLFIDPDWQKKGVATALLDEIKNQGFKDGHSFLTTDASITAMPFFSHQGFQILHQNTFELYGISISNFHMKWVY